jgi:hypothetical protein
MGESRGAYRVLVWKPEGRKSFGRPRHRRVENINIDFRDVGWVDMDWIDLAQGRDGRRDLVNAVMNIQVQ